MRAASAAHHALRGLQPNTTGAGLRNFGLPASAPVIEARSSAVPVPARESPSQPSRRTIDLGDSPLTIGQAEGQTGDQRRTAQSNYSSGSLRRRLAGQNSPSAPFRGLLPPGGSDFAVQVGVQRTPQEVAMLARQRELEESSISAAVERYMRDASSARKRGDVLSSRPAIQLIVSWHHPLTLAVRRFLESSDASEAGKGAGVAKSTAARTKKRGRPAKGAGVGVGAGVTENAHSVGRGDMDEAAVRFLKAVKPSTLAAIVVHETLAMLMRDLQGAPLASVANAVGNAVRAEINLAKLRELRTLTAKVERRQTEELAAASGGSTVRGENVEGSEEGHMNEYIGDPGVFEDGKPLGLHARMPLDSFGDDGVLVANAKRRRRKEKMGGAKGAAGVMDKKAMYKSMSLPSGVSAINYAASQADVADEQWSPRETIVVGTALINLLMAAAKVEVSPTGIAPIVGPIPADETAARSVPPSKNMIPAFRHQLVYNPRAMKKVGTLGLNDSVLRLLMGDDRNLREYIKPKLQPMIVRPRPWVSPTHGPYIGVPSKLVRAHPSKALEDALASADLRQVYDGLNALGETAWKVNAPVLNIAKTLWSEKRAVAGLVSRIDLPMPSKSDFYDIEAASQVAHEIKMSNMAADGDALDSAVTAADPQQLMRDEVESKRRADILTAVRGYKREKRKAQKTNRELFSLRAHTGYQLDQAEDFVNESRIYLPHNVDFRGRAYPIPVYLQHMGADLMRSMLCFAGSGVPLGDRGVYWLKVHLANLLGGGKLSFDERVALAEDSMPRALAAASDPLGDANLDWWGQAEDPFQLLAACFEFDTGMGRHGGAAALNSFHSRLPVSMDGSCNGLQHYAALGRDPSGGKQVNLIASERPQDVYIGVAESVMARVAEAAAGGDRIAKLLEGKVTRKVVKQTVMTSVYGVTLIGARAQIDGRLREIGGIPEEDIFAAALQLARWTLSSLGDIFSGASRTMDWLSASAKTVSRQGSEVQWLTPLGLPVIQPYRKLDSYMVKTAVQRVKVGFTGDHMPVSRARQQSAFAPNFVHSVDSSHMLLTAVDCRKRGIAFAAVHDSFWTHAASVDVMNESLRETFVNLHTRELLVELRDSMLMRHGHIRLPPLPERGDLDLREVLRSPYFFS